MFSPQTIFAYKTCKCNENMEVTKDSCDGETPVCRGTSILPLCSCRKTKVFCDDGSIFITNSKVNTALGCIPAKMDEFVVWLLPYLFGIGGGIAFLLMVYGFILITTSKGDPKAIQAARETITSAITGLLVSIFAIFILRLIAVDILKIPGMS